MTAAQLVHSFRRPAPQPRLTRQQPPRATAGLRRLPAGPEIGVGFGLAMVALWLVLLAARAGGTTSAVVDHPAGIAPAPISRLEIYPAPDNALVGAMPVP
jgi:hypothetical protein